MASSTADISKSIKRNTFSRTENYDSPTFRYGNDKTTFTFDTQEDCSKRSNDELLEQCMPKIKTSVFDDKIEESRPVIETIYQIWDGEIIEFDDQDIVILLQDLTNPENPEEEVTISRLEIDGKDQQLIAKGAMLYWTIGYREGFKYPRERFSKIVIRRLPQWSKNEIRSSKVAAQRLTKLFDEHSHNGTK